MLLTYYFKTRKKVCYLMLPPYHFSKAPFVGITIKLGMELCGNLSLQSSFTTTSIFYVIHVLGARDAFLCVGEYINILCM